MVGTVDGGGAHRATTSPGPTTSLLAPRVPTIAGLGRAGPCYHADDVGMSAAVNGATAALLEAGRLVGVSLVANGRATTDAAELVRRRPDLPVHLHLNLTEGRPVSGRAATRHLVGRDGAFRGPHRLVLALVRGEVDPADVEHELDAQLDRLDDLGVPVAGIDSHHHVHAFAPVGDIVARVAARRGLTGGRSYRLMRTHTPSGHAKKLLLSLLARASSWTSAGHGELPASWRTALGGAFAVASWERLDRGAASSPAVSTIVCHPGATCDRAPLLPTPNPPHGTTPTPLHGHVAADTATDATHRP